MVMAGSTSQSVCAQKKNRKKAQKIFKKGQALFEEGQYAEAGVEFLGAYQLDPHPAIMYNVGRAYEEQGKLIKAIQYYRVALGLKPSEAVADELNRKIAELELVLRADGVDVLNLETAQWVPKGRVTVQSDPTGAEVIINGQSAGKTPIKERVLPQGNYTFIVRRAGHRSEERAVTVVGGKHYMLNPRLRKGSEQEPALKMKPGMLDIDAPVSGLTIFVDGEPVATTPVGLIEASPGRHTVSVEGEGFPTFEENVEVVSGKTTRVAAGRRKAPIVTQEAAFLPQSGWGGMVVGIGASVVGVGAVMGSLAQADASTYQSDRGSPARAFVREDAINKALVADIAYGAGLTLLLSGVLMVTFDDDADEGDYGGDLVWRLSPVLVPEGVGLATGARW